MNLFSSSWILYLMIGAGVGLSVYLTDSGRSWNERTFRVMTAVLFWPLYVPVLLRRARQDSASVELEPMDDMAAGIAQVDSELQAALGSLRGWAEGVLTREKDRLGELRLAWTLQAQRIREMDRLLSLPEPATPAKGVMPRRHQSEQARQRNLQSIQNLRERAYNDLMGTLAWVRELVSMIHLAKFTGAPPSRAEEIVAQIAAAVEGLSNVTWQDAVKA